MSSHNKTLLYLGPPTAAAPLFLPMFFLPLCDIFVICSHPNLNLPLANFSFIFSCSEPSLRSSLPSFLMHVHAVLFCHLFIHSRMSLPQKFQLIISFTIVFGFSCVLLFKSNLQKHLQWSRSIFLLLNMLVPRALYVSAELEAGRIGECHCCYW